MSIQLEFFPEFFPTFYAYEIDWDGSGETTWEAYMQGDDDIFAVIDRDAFGDWLDFIKGMGYDVRINTYESWIAMEDRYA